MDEMLQLVVGSHKFAAENVTRCIWPEVFEFSLEDLTARAPHACLAAYFTTKASNRLLHPIARHFMLCIGRVYARRIKEIPLAEVCMHHDHSWPGPTMCRERFLSDVPFVLLGLLRGFLGGDGGDGEELPPALRGLTCMSRISRYTLYADRKNVFTMRNIEQNPQINLELRSATHENFWMPLRMEVFCQKKGKSDFTNELFAFVGLVEDRFPEPRSLTAARLVNLLLQMPPHFKKQRLSAPPMASSMALNTCKAPCRRNSRKKKTSSTALAFFPCPVAELVMDFLLGNGCIDSQARLYGATNFFAFYLAGFVKSKVPDPRLPSLSMASIFTCFKKLDLHLDLRNLEGALNLCSPVGRDHPYNTIPRAVDIVQRARGRARVSLNLITTVDQLFDTCSRRRFARMISTMTEVSLSCFDDSMFIAEELVDDIFCAASSVNVKRLEICGKLADEILCIPSHLSVSLYANSNLRRYQSLIAFFPLVRHLRFVASSSLHFGHPSARNEDFDWCLMSIRDLPHSHIVSPFETPPEEHDVELRRLRSLEYVLPASFLEEENGKATTMNLSQPLFVDNNITCTVSRLPRSSAGRENEP